MIYVISDLHGYPHDMFLTLLEKGGFTSDDFLYVIGDVIDKNGDGGITTLQWLMKQQNAVLLRGNHEAMLLGCSYVFDAEKGYSEEGLTREEQIRLIRYKADGGRETLAAMRKLPREGQQEILEYLRATPLYKILSIDGKEYILVHAGLGNFSKTKRIEDYSEKDLLWYWPELTDKYYDDVFTVFGHTPTFSFGDRFSNKIIKTDTWMDIDMGAGFGREPVLVRLDDMSAVKL